MASDNESGAVVEGDSGYRVVVFATADDPHEFRDLLTERLSMHPTDAMILVHATPGILPERLDKSGAEQLASAIEELGLTTKVISASEIPDFVHATQVHNVSLEDEGLAILSDGDQQVNLIAWPEIELLSVGQIPGTIKRHFHFETDIILTPARRRYIAPDELSGKSTTVLWILCENLRKGFRIEKTHMNFSSLGDRLTESATTNFRLFVEEIASRATTAFQTPATRNYLGHGTLRHIQFADEEELERYTAFHLIVREWLQSN